MISVAVVALLFCFANGEVQQQPRTFGLLTNLAQGLGQLIFDDSGYNHNNHHHNYYQPPLYNFYPPFPYYNYRPNGPFGFPSPGFPGFNNAGFQGLGGIRDVDVN